VAIIGIVAAAILGSLMIAISSSGVHRNLSTDDTLAKSALEAVKNQVELAQTSTTDFVDCGTTSNGPSSILTAWNTPSSGKYITLPSQAGYTVAISNVTCWDTVSHQFDSTCTSASPCNPGGLLQVTVSVTDPSNYTLRQSTLVRNPDFNNAYNGKY
jgi:type II secretory pathway pseudopilin PulG